MMLSKKTAAPRDTGSPAQEETPSNDWNIQRPSTVICVEIAQRTMLPSQLQQPEWQRSHASSQVGDHGVPGALGTQRCLSKSRVAGVMLDSLA